MMDLYTRIPGRMRSFKIMQAYTACLRKNIISRTVGLQRKVDLPLCQLIQDINPGLKSTAVPSHHEIHIR